MDTNEFKAVVEAATKELHEKKIAFVLISMSDRGMMITGNASHQSKVLAEAFGQSYVTELVEQGALKRTEPN